MGLEGLTLVAGIGIWGLAWLTRRALRVRRGGLQLSIAPSKAGSPVTGTLTVSARRQLPPAELQVCLIGVEEWWNRETSHGEIEPMDFSHITEIYRFRQVLDRSFQLERGEKQTLVFSLPTPHPQTGKTPDGAEAVLVERPVSNSHRPSRQYWAVEASHRGLGQDHKQRVEVPLAYQLDGRPLLAADATRPPRWLARFIGNDERT